MPLLPPEETLLLWNCYARAEARAPFLTLRIFSAQTWLPRSCFWVRSQASLSHLSSSAKPTARNSSSSAWSDPCALFTTNSLENVNAAFPEWSRLLFCSSHVRAYKTKMNCQKSRKRLRIFLKSYNLHKENLVVSVRNICGLSSNDRDFWFSKWFMSYNE